MNPHKLVSELWVGQNQITRFKIYVLSKEDSKIARSKVDIEKFDGDGDFSLWKCMMYAYLSVSGLKDLLVTKKKT